MHQHALTSFANVEGVPFTALTTKEVFILRPTPLCKARLGIIALGLALLAVPTLTSSVSAQHGDEEVRGHPTPVFSGYRPQFYIRTMDQPSQDGEIAITINVTTSTEAGGTFTHTYNLGFEIDPGR